jgi:hypothetical protein
VLSALYLSRILSSYINSLLLRDPVQHNPPELDQDTAKMHFLCLHGAIGNVAVCEKRSLVIRSMLTRAEYQYTAW